jgi:hypothetical protein
MRLELDGEPVHTRALSLVVRAHDGGRVDARGSLLDLRTRGFLPLGGSMQGMGIIHHMELGWIVDPASGTIETFTPAQPTVAFEASPETAGESCRDPIDRVSALKNVRLDASFGRTLREHIGGPLGCSHLVTLAHFMAPGVQAGLGRERTLGFTRAEATPGETLFRRDLVFEGHELAPGRVAMGMRLGDLHWNAAGPGPLAPARFALHHELAARLDVDLWPGSLVHVTGGERLRTAERFAGADWVDRNPMLAALDGLGLARGAAGELRERLGDSEDTRPWREALLMLAPALVQCRAAHPDSWQEKVRATERHPGLTAIPDSCFMWRAGGALERLRAAHGAVKGGR